MLWFNFLLFLLSCFLALVTSLFIDVVLYWLGSSSFDELNCLNLLSSRWNIQNSVVKFFFFLPKFFLLAYLLSALLSLTFVAHDSWWIHWQIHLIFFTVVLNLLEVKICKILLRNSRICFFKKIFFAYKACINAYSKEVQMQIE